MQQLFLVSQWCSGLWLKEEVFEFFFNFYNFLHFFTPKKTSAFTLLLLLVCFCFAFGCPTTFIQRYLSFFFTLNLLLFFFVATLEWKGVKGMLKESTFLLLCVEHFFCSKIFVFNFFQNISFWSWTFFLQKIEIGIRVDQLRVNFFTFMLLLFFLVWHLNWTFYSEY